MANVDILPIHGNQDSEFSLSFMVVSTEHTVRTKLIDALLDQGERQQYKYKLFAHSCEKLRQFVSSHNTEVHLDFIIFVIDLDKQEWFNDIDENLRYLDKAFFFGRFCFILTQFSPNHVNATAAKVRVLREKYQCHILVLINDIVNSEKWSSLAERVLNLCTAVCGLKSGMSPCIKFK